MEVFLTHTTKHIVAAPSSGENGREWMDVMAVIADAAGLDVEQTPLMMLGAAVTSPLQMHGPNVEIIKMALERCYPVISTVCPMAGSTALPCSFVRLACAASANAGSPETAVSRSIAAAETSLICPRI